MSDEVITSWDNQHIYKVREQRDPQAVAELDSEKLRREIEPWMTALFQSEHLSLLMGVGISSATHWLAKQEAGAGMSQIDFSVFKEQIEKAGEESAKKSGRGIANIEDQIRVANELIKGMEIYISTGIDGADILGEELRKFKEELQQGLNTFSDSVLICERNITQSPSSELAAEYLMSFFSKFCQSFCNS